MPHGQKPSAKPIRTPISASGRCRSTEKQGLVDDVFHSVARRYDLMNDLMSGGLHRAWKDILVTAVNPPKSDRAFHLLDVAGGTGDIAMRVVEAGGAGTQATVLDINADMLAVGRERAQARGLDHAVTFVRRQCRGAGAARTGSFDAYTIAFGIRNVPRIDAALREACRVLKPGGHFLCLEFSSVDVPGPRAALRALFIQCHSGDRPRGCGRRGILSLSRGIDPQIPAAGTIRRHDPRRRLRVASAISPCPAASSRCIPAGGCNPGSSSHRDLLPHPSRPSCPRGFRVRARGRVQHGRSGDVPAPARAGLYLAHMIERPTSSSRRRPAVGGTDRLGPDLCQARPIPGDAAGHRRRADRERAGNRCRTRCRRFRKAKRKPRSKRPSGCRSSRCSRASAAPVAAASIAQVHRAEIETPEGRKAVAVKVLRPGIERRFKVDQDAFVFAARNGGRILAPRRSGCA